MERERAGEYEKDSGRGAVPQKTLKGVQGGCAPLPAEKMSAFVL